MQKTTLLPWSACLLSLFLVGCQPVPMPAKPTLLIEKKAPNPPPSEPVLTYWVPPADSTYQIQLSDYPSTLELNVDIFELDLFEISAPEIDYLHQQEKKVVCYMNAGAWEDFRPDAGAFPEEVIGNDYIGWPGERWLDISRYQVFADAILARLDLALEKGCDGVDADNLDAYLQPTGFTIRAEDQIAYNRWLSKQAHDREMAIAMKNGGKQVAALVEHFDFAIIEDCAFFNECSAFQPFIDNGKAVVQIEYTDYFQNISSFCQESHSRGYISILKNRSLDAFVQSCD